MKIQLILKTIGLVLLSGCSVAPTQQAGDTPPVLASANAALVNGKYDYPTRDRVQYVLDCIAQHADSAVKFGQVNYVTQFACGCKIDKIAEQLSFADFEAAVAGGYLSKMAGESGSAFRNSQKELRKNFKDIEKAAEKSCFIN